MTKVIKSIDLKNVPCPLNVVKCKLTLEKISKTDTLIVELDKGEPELMVRQSLEKMGYKLIKIEEGKEWIRFSICYGFQ